VFKAVILSRSVLLVVINGLSLKQKIRPLRLAGVCLFRFLMALGFKNRAGKRFILL